MQITWIHQANGKPMKTNPEFKMQKISNVTPAMERGIKLLSFICYGFLAFAAIWWLAVHPAIDKPAALLLDILDWPLDGGHDNMGRDARFLSAIGAGLLVSLIAFLVLVVIPEFRRGNLRIWTGTVIALSSWYIVDSAGCIIVGVPSNAFFNTLFFIMLLVPLWMIRKGADI